MARYNSMKFAVLIDLNELYKMSLVRSIKTQPFSRYSGTKNRKKKKFDRPTRFYRLRLRLSLRLRIGGIFAKPRLLFLTETGVFMCVELKNQGPVFVSFWESGFLSSVKWRYVIMCELILLRFFYVF
jgi:hypothetical protein